MVDLIEFPTHQVTADSLPKPGDRYEAYGVAHKRQPVSLSFISPDWSIASIPYGRMEFTSFEPLDGHEDGNGQCRHSMYFGTTQTGGLLATVTGYNLRATAAGVAEQRLRWMWQLPENRDTVPEGSSVVHSIAFRQIEWHELFPLFDR